MTETRFFDGAGAMVMLLPMPPARGSLDASSPRASVYLLLDCSPTSSHQLAQSLPAHAANTR
jgi:hypothetical protein